MSYSANETEVEYGGRRIRLATNAHFDALVAAFEAAVPALSEPDAARRLAEDTDWPAFVRGVQWESPSGFVRVWTSRPDVVMRHAGNSAKSVLWLLVHHGIAARMFRHDPAAALYSSLRIEAHTTSEPGTTLGFDVPSAQFAGFESNKIRQGGAELDRALGDLLEDLGLPRPSALRR
ncbi:hypothetical protein GCM10011490_17970 [Pseudoclavibacter endophyticus]|uniref:DUF302 domain-containing protein n=1 Tax=Pseudoclavibacter endophyticus TaxID=1778590 RepID=A0A6H9WPZ1_9MICO|nr:hypothetical protein [Pseudoclavibacter endophyticus]KAB1648855.1 hypothetical protein F8O04_00680 [Pseudoclavibacter endophyticus]GGA67807.1 hypothetical protein GCM10011490_17970 [Pseudoclavibacter endophyticus]